GHDVAMVQGGGGFGFHAKTSQGTLVNELAPQNQLERHDPVQFSLSRLVDYPHAAPGNLPQQFIVAELASRGRGRGGLGGRGRSGKRASEPGRGGNRGSSSGRGGNRRSSPGRGGGRGGCGLDTGDASRIQTRVRHLVRYNRTSVRQQRGEGTATRRAGK